MHALIQLVVDKATAKKLKLGKMATVIGTLTRAVGRPVPRSRSSSQPRPSGAQEGESVKLSVRVVATDAAGNAAAPVIKRLTVKN